MAKNSNSTEFDPNDKKYKCLWGKCHVKTVTNVIGWVDGVSLGLGLILALILSSSLTQISVNMGGPLISFFIAVILIEGVRKESPALLVPYLVLQGVEMVVVGTFTLALVTLYMPQGDQGVMYLIDDIGYLILNTKRIKRSKNMKSSGGGNSALIFGWGVVVFCLVILALRCWILYVVRKCYRYFKDKKMVPTASISPCDVLQTAHNGAETQPPAYCTVVAETAEKGQREVVRAIMDKD